MKDYKNLFKIAGIINIITGVLLLTASHSFLCIIQFIMAAILLYIYQANEKSNTDNRGIILVLAIISIPLNFLVSIILFIALFNMKSNYPITNPTNAPPEKKVIIKKKVIDPEVKKIDTLLKLGVAMVFISGVLFATTSWDFISDLFKAIALIVLGTLFICLSTFSEKKLKLYNTTFMYWILGLSFYLLTIIGMLYFGVAGDFLTYNGVGSSLAYAITCFTFTGLTMATYLKFSNKGYLYASYGGMIALLIFVFDSLKLQPISIVLIITIISILINILSKKESILFSFNKILSYILVALTLRHLEDANEIVGLITSLLNIANITYMTYKDTSKTYSILNLIISYILILASVSNLSITDNIKITIMFVTSMSYVLLTKFNIIETSSEYQKINYIIHSVLSFALIVYCTEYGDIVPLILSGLFLATNYISRIKLLDTEEISIARYIEPAIIFTIILLINELDSVPSVIFSSLLAITTFVYTTISIVTKDEKEKKIYTISSYIGILLFFLMSLDDYNAVASVLMMIPCAYYLCRFLSETETNNYKKIVAFIITIYSIYNNLYILDVFSMSKIISSILMIVILAASIYFMKDDAISKTSYFLIVVPLYNLITNISAQTEISQIAISILILYITFLIAKFFVDVKNREAIAIIGIVISTISLFQPNNIILGIYVGIIGIATIMLGYYDKSNKGLFITGIIITVINIIVQLIDLWEQIPFWLYLLVCGLGLIFFVTYKEVKKMNKK